MATEVRDNPEKSRYEITVDGELAVLTEYRRHGEVADFVHTETQAGFEGKGLASQLIKATLDDVRTRGWQVRPYCPFVRGYIAKHPEYVDLVPQESRAEFELA